MARANRHFIPGHVWHPTNRCHKGEFLLKFSKDRDRWMELLFEAKHLYQLSVLNFNAISNHVHLILYIYFLSICFVHVFLRTWDVAN